MFPAHDGIPLNVTAETSPPFCPNGWVPPPESANKPEPPPDVECSGLPCEFNRSAYIVGGTFLFDLDNDPHEHHDLASANPETVAALMAKLQAFNATKVPQDNPPVDPRSSPTHFNSSGEPTWTPWLGDPDPTKCATPPPPPPPSCPSEEHPEGQCMGSVDGLGLGATCGLSGWCSGPGYSGPSMEVQLVVDGKKTGKPVLGTIHRQIAGNHGFVLPFDCALAAHGRHTFQATARLNQSTPVFTVGEKCAVNGRSAVC